MKMILKLCDMMEDELRGAEEYIDCAIKHKADQPDVARDWASMSEVELEHFGRLHADAERIIEQVRSQTGAPDQSMMQVYQYLHKKYVAWKTRILAKHNEFKS